MPAAATLATLGVTGTGLTQSDADERIRIYGANRLPEAARRGPLRRFLGQFHNILIYVLLGAAGVTAALGHGVDSGVILAVVFANAVVGFIQEGKAEQAMAAIRKMLSPRSSVLRDGVRATIDSNQIVPGDILVLEAGDKVPADLRLIDANGLRVDEAILTGESVPIDKSVEPVSADAALGDRSCMAFSGTLVVSGAGRGVTVATGAATEIGRISGMLSEVETLATPLTQQMDSFARWLTGAILTVAAALLAYGASFGHLPFADLFMAIVGLSVAAIPEGLPAVLTVTLAVGVQAMARRNAIVRRLPAIETIGSVSVICSDKTGTLTRNEMLATSIVTSEAAFDVTGTGYAPFGSIRFENLDIDPAQHPVLLDIGHAATLCNDAALRKDEADWKADGDPMEGALKALAGKILRDESTAGAMATRSDSIPFDATHRYMAVLVHDHAGHAWIHVKGAPERLLAMCVGQKHADGSIRALETAYWHRQVDDAAAAGQRVIALASRPVAQEHVVLNTTDLDGQMVLLGLIGLHDPPRPEAVAAVAECREAGIRVKMITGDHAGTATAISRMVGLTNTDRVLTGSDLENMSDADLAAAAASTDVFARTSPSHKLRLVTALQSLGLSVAMTGDGVNDSPALKRADAGIAMGRKGSEAAKEASDLVLADDNFATIVNAVREGRTVYDNIKKVISWTLPTSAGEALTIVFALLMGMSLPVTAVQILWVNLVTAITLGIALAFEPTEDNTMLRPPRRRNEPLLSGALIWHVAFVSSLFLAAVFGIYAHAVGKGHAPELARTMALNTLVVLEIFHLFFIRNIYGTSLTWKAAQGTGVVWLCVVAVTAAQFAVTYLPPLQRTFGTAPVPILDGLLIVGVGILFFAVIETEKQVQILIQRRRDARIHPPAAIHQDP